MGAAGERQEACDSQPLHLLALQFLEMDDQARVSESNPWTGQMLSKKTRLPATRRDLTRLMN